jgi:hypothetical protein
VTQLEKERATPQNGKVVYTAKTRTTGGRENGACRSSDGHLDIKLSTPARRALAPIRSNCSPPAGRPVSKVRSGSRPAKK